MSSSEEITGMLALPWALDEFASNDIFPASGPSDAASTMHAAADSSHAMYSESERSRIEGEAYARGVADGERIARDQVAARVNELLSSLTSAIDSIRIHESRWVGNAEENVAALAVGVARHIVQREITTDASAVQALVQRAIAQFPLDQMVTVRLNPDDHALCASISEGRAKAGDVQWIPDAHITRGGCLVEGRERIIDGRIDTALERLYRTIGQVQS
jgi:flagellar biosynthesis/type III secretory pathway protein FliH